MMTVRDAQGLRDLIKSQVGRYAKVRINPVYFAGGIMFNLLVEDRASGGQYTVGHPDRWFESVCTNFPAPQE